MSHRTKPQRRSWKERALCLLLSAVMLAGMMPGTILPASAHWADEYLSQLVDWGVMRADQAGDPNAAITRAEFAAIINRAYGYNEVGPIPFTDVQPSDWFYDDIRIAYTAGYMAGTSSSTAAPHGFLTREMATCILARNMMMKESPAENLAFADSREISSWARGLVKTAVDNYVLSGYPDNRFGPKNYVSKGEMAALVTRCVGNPLNQPGEYTLGDVFNNVTITSSNVTLRDTSISGDLYVSGGVGLGNVKLENVRVLGRIIVSGTGESELGDASVVMRNVTAEEMLVDNMRDKTVTLRAEGLTNVAKTVVRTNAYLEDNAPDENGLRQIVLEGNGTQLDLAGRIKEVLSQAPMANIQVAKGTVEKLTVDEASTNATVQIDRNTEVKELNLDVAANIIGDGDVKQMNINAPGVTSSVFPEKLYIRPGLTGNVGGEDLDSAGAEEYSRDPKILSGYPIASDVAPTSLRADFATNKKGTVYWAVSNITDGSLSAGDLVSPPSYGSAALKNGSVAVPSADTVVNAQVTGLTTAGSYYLSAVMQDNRGVRSPVKVISFTTPDNSKPAFAQGYPRMSLVTDTLAQAVVMPTKSCKLYYAVLPQGAAAPTPNELRSASVTGNLGYGVLDVVKNTELTFVASRRLEELKDYVLYLWLCDADGTNSSNVQSLRFKTVDSTAPRYSPEASISSVGQTNVNLTVGLDEPGTIYWAVVPRGKAYPLPNNQNPNDNVQDAAGVSTADLTKEFAKLQVKNGRNATKSGSVRIANANTDTAMNITGLARETAYDLYYIGQDSAGNFASEVKKIAINTLDNTPPTVKQYFSRYTGRDNTRDPLVTTDIMLEFSEDIRSSTNAGGGKSLLDLYAAISSTSSAERTQARKDLTDLLEKSITLYQHSTSSVANAIVPLKPDSVHPETGTWIDFSKATVTSRDGAVVVTLPYKDDPESSAHRLGSGSTYHFEIKNITDNSDAQNAIVPNPVDYRNMGTTHNVPTFTTVFAQVILSTPTLDGGAPIVRKITDVNAIKGNIDPGEDAPIDYSFRMAPDATETVDDGHSYDLLLYTGTSMAFDLYCRIKDKDGRLVTTVNDAANAGILAKTVDGTVADTNGWLYLGNSGAVYPNTSPEDGLRGVSVNGKDTLGDQIRQQHFPKVNSLNDDYTYDFVISLTRLGNTIERGVWAEDDVSLQVHVVAGPSSRLVGYGGLTTEKSRDEATSLPLTGGGLVSIGEDTDSGNKYLTLSKNFIDTRVPKFVPTFPNIDAGDTFANIDVSLDRAGTIYYVVAPYDRLTPVISNDTSTAIEIWNKLPTQGQNLRNASGGIDEYFYKKGGTAGSETDKLTISTPDAPSLIDPRIYGSTAFNYPSRNQTETLEVKNLLPNTKYIAYFVLKGSADTTSQVFAYAFETTNVSRPKINLTDNTNGTVGIGTQVPAEVDYIVFTQADANRISWLTNKTPTTGQDSGLLSAHTIDLDGKALPDAYKNFTLLEALATPYNFSTASKGTNPYIPAPPPNDPVNTAYDGYSVFDIYADDQIKQKVGELVRQSLYREVAEVIGTGNRTTTAQAGINNYPYRAIADGLTNVKPNINYILFAVAHHTSSEEIIGDSYAARDPFMNLQMDPPKLTGFSGNAKRDTNGTYYGSFTLTFDTNLYWVAKRGDSPVPVYQVKRGQTPTGAISLVSYFAPSSSQIKLNVPQVNNNATNVFNVEFTGLSNGDTLTLFSNGEISSERGQTRGAEKLTITCREVVNNNGQFTVYLDAKLGSNSSESFTVSAGSGTVNVTPNP